MAMSGGGPGGLSQQQEGGGFGQFFRGDLPKKLGTLLVSWLESAASQRHLSLLTSVHTRLWPLHFK